MRSTRLWHEAEPEIHVSLRHAGRRPGTGLLGNLAAFILVALLVLGAGARPAAAHATLLSISPAGDELLDRAPEAVELTFDEPVEVLDGGVRVFDSSGARVDEGRAEAEGGGAVVRVPIDGERQGTYTVAWRVLSEDSHNISGSFVFHVGSRTGAVELDDGASTVVDGVGGVARFLGFVGLLGVAGASLVGVLANGEVVASDRLRRVAIISGLVGCVAAVAVLVVQTAQSAGRSLLDAVSIAPELAVDTRTGQLTLLRAGALALAAALAASAPVWRRAPWSPAVAAVVGMVALTGAGHAWTVSTRGVAVVADLVHLGAVGSWIGGLAAMAVALPVVTDHDRLARRFSRVALVAAVVVLVSGSVSGYLQVRSVEALTSTGYGQLLLAKVAGFAVLIALGWWNQTVLIPQVANALNALVRSVRIEVVVAAGVLAVTAGLVNQPPASTTLREPFSTVVTADAVVLQVSVEPARTGSNDIHLYFFDEASQILPVDAVEVTAAVGDIPPRRLDITPIASNHMSAYGAALTSPGTWTINVTAVRAGVPTTFTFEVPIR